MLRELDEIRLVTRLREATPADAASIARLMKILGYPTSVAAMRTRLEMICPRLDYHTVVAEVDGEVRGMIGLRSGVVYECDRPCVQVLVLVVDEKCQETGVGAALLREADTWTVELGATRIILTSGKYRSVAHRFYELHGYEPTGVRFVKTA